MTRNGKPSTLQTLFNIQHNIAQSKRPSSSVVKLNSDELSTFAVWYFIKYRSTELNTTFIPHQCITIITIVTVIIIILIIRYNKL